MCVTVEVALPTIRTFLLVFSLRTGCFIILFWTSFRSCFEVLFFASAILEVLVRRKSPLGAWIVPRNKKYYDDDNFYSIYYLYVVMLVIEAILLLFTVVYLAWGLCWEKRKPLKHYLCCRILTWVIEVSVLFTLCIEHQLLIGWYLVLLLFVTLELYSIIAVYSYYVNITYIDGDINRKYSEEVQNVFSFYPSPKSKERTWTTNTLLEGIYRT
ncbi:unnamed protein product, partial [Iphiclides podalirius]